MSHADESEGHKSPSLKKTLLLALGALGVVYGDIGTSPLYSIKEMFFGHGVEHVLQPVTIIGGISVVIWALTVIVAFKYIVFVLRADNEGEGGVFALYGLIHKLKKKQYVFITLLLIFAAGLLFGDGIITPAISVLSAVEGLSVATKAFDPYVIPVTIGILTALFMIQSKGTSKVGTIFGPIMIVWFVSIGLLGLFHISQQPYILAAINPLNALHFVTHHPIHELFIILGAVMLVVTGGEALYADMGHFGKFPIRISWFSIVFPALIFNYLGQGAFLLSGKEAVQGNIFFSMVPHWGLYPMVVLATLATVIASQALISGAFSLATQAISLGLFPYLDVDHTNDEHEGQIYLSFINWALFVGSILLVLSFRSSTRLASVYGLAVSGVMLVTTLGMIIVSQEIWKWKKGMAYGFFIPLLMIDALFFSANSLKFIEGGYIPVFIGLTILLISKTWLWGRTAVKDRYENYPVQTVRELIKVKNKTHVIIPRTVIIMSPKPVENLSDEVPVLKQIFWERYGALPNNIIFLTVVIKDYPYVKDRFAVKNLYDEKGKGAIYGVKLFYGFMEEPMVEKALSTLANHHMIDVEDDYKHWLVMVIHERVLPGKMKSWIKRIRFAIFKIMQRNTATADHYFGLGEHQPLAIEVLPVYFK